MKVLVIGDEHTYGYGLTGGNLSFIGHFVRQIRLSGQPVSVDMYAHLTMAQVLATLAQLPLGNFDLIILQLDQRLIQSTKYKAVSNRIPETPVLPYCLTLAKPVRTAGGLSGMSKALGTLVYSLVCPTRSLALSNLLKQLRPYRHNVLLLSPFPQREYASRWLRLRSRALLLREAAVQLFSVFDSDAVIRPKDEYFLPDDSAHLNAISHELLGRSLFDFYQSAPTIVTIQAIRRE